MLRLKGLLWGLAWLLRRGFRSSEPLRQKLAEQPLSFRIATQAWSGRFFVLDAQGIRSGTDAETRQATDLQLVFTDAASAWQTLTSKNKNAFMQAIQDKHLGLQGDFQKLLQLQQLMRLIKKA